jgi:Flp pilus assembly protein TadB
MEAFGRVAIKEPAMINLASGKRYLWPLVILAVLICVAIPAGAQTVSGTFKVVCIADRNATEIRHQKGCVSTIPRLSFGDEVTLAVEHASNVTFDDSGEPNPTDLVLFLDGKALPGTNASVGLSQTDEDDVTTTLLTYRIIRDLTSQTARKNWKEVLVAANTGRRLALSTGLESGPAAQSRAVTEFIAVRSGRLVWWFIVAVVGLLVFFWMAGWTGALRDKEPSGPIKNPTDRAFSLSRVQMALWTILTIYAYLYIWMLTGEYLATIPASVVGLMGITLATYGSAAAVDASNVQTNKEKLKEAKQKDAAKPHDPDLKDEVEKLEARTTVCKTEGFFRDITTSADGASIHRLQFIFWTLALAVVFVTTVWKTLAMPDFDATLLGLMGITSGTYVGLKIPEKKV